MRRAGCALVLLAGVFAPNGADAQQPAPVRLTRPAALAPKLDALPRVAAARNDRAAQRINQALAQGDARVRAAAKSCRDSAGAERSSWTRAVSVTMQGPRYLSVTATDEWYCGGAQPDASSLALVYDLRTGAPVNWARLLPAAMVQATRTDTVGDGTVIGTVTSDPLADLYRNSGKPETVDPQCKQAIAESSLTFLLWPDAKQDSVMIKPSGLPHVIAACGVAVAIPTATLRPLGVGADLLDAVDAAHRRTLGRGKR